jgi:hypothetical protein
MLENQEFYHLSHTLSSFFVLLILEIGSHERFAWDTLNYNLPDLTLPSS